MNWRNLALIYVALLLLSLLLTRFAPPAPLALSSGIAPATRIIDRGALSIRLWVDNILLEHQLNAKYQMLKTDYAKLKEEYRQQQRELSQLRQAVQIRATQSPALLTLAPIESFDPSPLLSRFTISIGNDKGVTRAMTATVPQGLVGQVIEVSRNKSVVLTLVDPDSRVGVTVAGRSANGTAFGMAPDRLRAEFPRNAQLQVGDLVSTGSIGGVYPSGIPIGTIESIQPLGENATTRSVIVKPAVDFSNLEEVALLQAL